jgi:Ca2+-binding RTX toxin-like protein
MDHKRTILAIGVAVVTVAATAGSSDPARQEGRAPSGTVVVQAAASARPAAAIRTPAVPRLDEQFAWPLVFVENAGQVDGPVRYSATGRGWEAYFTPRGVTYTLRAPASLRSGVDAEQVSHRWVVRLRFPGSAQTVPSGRGATPTTMSYFTGPRSEWATGVRTFDRVVYRDLWPGIDAVYSGAGGALKYSFVVHPGADPDQIRLAYRGGQLVEIDGRGRVRVGTPVGDLVEGAPRSFQARPGGQARVMSAWTHPRGGGGHALGFEVGRYRSDRRLVIDPATTLYAGYIGGWDRDWAEAITVDASGAAYVAGTTESQFGFPTRVGPDFSFNGWDDAFVAKVRPDGTGLEYAGFIGGGDEDAGLDIAVDATGAAYVTGFTHSNEATFPVHVGPDVTYNESGFGMDAFVAKVSPDGTELEYAGYIGGDDWDNGHGVAVDASGAAYVTGDTFSTQASFPVSVGPDLTYSSITGGDGFVAKVRPDGASLAYAGYVGGAAHEQPEAIAVDDTGAAYIAGWTYTTENTFPVAVGPDLTYGGDGAVESGDGFVAKVRADGTALAYAGYVGGGEGDKVTGLAVDASGSLHVAGTTTSSPADGFPVRIGPSLSYFGGGDTFVAKVVPTGSELAYAGYLGSADPQEYDPASGIGLSPDGEVFVAIGSFDGRLARVGTDPTTFEDPWGPALRAEYINDVAVDPIGDVHVTGRSFGNLVTAFGPSTFTNGSDEAFVARLSPCTRTGTAGADRLTGTTARDVICGLGGNDMIIGSRGDDIVDGGAGSDTVSFASSLRAVDVDLGSQFFPGSAIGMGADRLTSVENVIGSRFKDHIRATDGVPNRIDGRAGNDTIEDFNFDQVDISRRNILIGGAGEDTIDSDGDSRMIGGPGDDDLESEAADDVLLGGPGDDVLKGRKAPQVRGRADQVFDGGPGDDVLDSGGGNDLVRGGSGTDELIFQFTLPRFSYSVVVDLAKRRSIGLGGDPSDNIDRVVGIEDVTGGPSDDVIRGDRRSNRLAGGGGNDIIRGDSGDDFLLGGRGNDRLTGGRDLDHCRQGPGRGPLRGCEFPRRPRVTP